MPLGSALRIRLESISIVVFDEEPSAWMKRTFLRLGGEVGDVEDFYLREGNSTGKAEMPDGPWKPKGGSSKSNLCKILHIYPNNSVDRAA